METPRPSSVAPPAPPVSEQMISKSTSVTVSHHQHAVFAKPVVAEGFLPAVCAAAFNTVCGHFAPIRLHFAINSGQLEKLSRLIDSGVDLNFAAPSNGQTPLLLSILTHRLDMAVALVEAGADVTVPEKTSWRRRPIHLAARAGHCGLVADILQRAPGEVYATDAMCFTPLHSAAVRGQDDVVQLLISSGAELDAVDDRGRTPLFRAAEYGHTTVVEQLAAAGAHIDWIDAFGWTALYQSALCGQFDMVALLLRLGASVDGAGGESPVLAAAGKPSQRTFGMLHDVNVDFYMRRRRAQTLPIHQAGAIACQPGDSPPDILDLLIDHGASVQVRDCDGLSALRLAALSGRYRAIQLLVAAGADVSDEFWVIECRWPPAIAGDVALCDWLYAMAMARVRPLAELCRLAIRRLVRPCVRSSVAALPLPDSLISYLQILQN